MNGIRISNFFRILLFLLFYSISFAQTTLDIITEDHLGGYSTSVAANDQYVFLCEAYGLRVLNFDGTAFSQAGSLVLTNPGLVMYANNSDLFVGSENNLIRVGFSDPSYLTVPASNNFGVTSDEINSIFTLSDKVFITQFNWTAKTGSFRILNKSNLSQLGSLDVACQDVYVVGSNAYVITGHSQIDAGSQFLKIYDVSNSSNITETGSVQLAGAEKLVVSGNYAYVVGGQRLGITIVDIINAATPTIVATDLIANVGLTRISLSGNTVYASGGKNMYIADITNPIVPAHSGTSESDYYVTQFATFSASDQNDYFVYIGDGKLNSFNITNPQNPSVGPQNEGPNRMNTMTITGTNLLVGDATSIWRYDLPNSDARSKLITTSNKKISSNGNNLYVVSDESAYSKLKIYDISNINSPQQKGTYQSGSKISRITARGNYVYLLREDSKIIEVIDVSNASTPANAFNYELTEKGTNIFASKDFDKNILYAGYYGNEASKGIELINITDPPASTKISTIATSGKPQGIHASRNNLYIGSHTSTEQGWYLEAFDVTNTQAPVLSAQTSNTSAGEIIWDIFALENRLLVSFTLNGLKTYELVQGTGNEQSLFKETSTDNGTLTQTSSSSGVHYTHDITAYQNGANLYVYANANTWFPGMSIPFSGYKGIFKLQIPGFPPVAPGKVLLTLAVSPAAAATAGCSTNPAPNDPHDYDINADVPITAIENADEGWFFKEWTGASGGKSTNIHMDANKNVIANFVEVKLTASGSKVRFTKCPHVAAMNPVYMLQAKFCASEASGWSLNGFKVRGYGSGDELFDIESFFIYQGSNLKFSGLYTSDDGQLNVTFNPPIIVPANQCVKLDLMYDIGPYERFIRRDTVHTYSIKVQDINATPLEYPEGAIKGTPESKDGLIIAHVYNSKQEGFTSIQGGIDGTDAGDTCYICRGEYNESINLSKPVSLVAVEEVDNTIINSGTDRLLYISSDQQEYSGIPFSIEGFSLTANSTQQFNPIELNRAVDFKLRNNKVSVNKVRMENPRRLTVSGNIFYGLESWIINEATYVDIRYNQTISGSPKLEVYGSSDVKINSNSNSNTALEVKIGRSKNLWAISKNIQITYNTLEKIYASDYEKIEISSNILSGLILGMGVNGSILDNEIHLSSNPAIILNGANSIKIINNNVYDNDKDGIVVQFAKNCYIAGNVVENNKGDGISVNMCKESIKLFHNYVGGHVEQGKSGILVLDSKNTTVQLNDVRYNCTGIKVKDSQNTILEMNTVKNNTCNNTGINLDNSSPKIFGNSISSNEGNGIYAVNGSNPVVRNNNISGNSLKGIQNDDLSITLDASGNWWGNDSGPTPSDIDGDIDVTSWLTSPASLLSAAGSDTLFVTAGNTDSCFVHFQNFENFDDQINVSITDEQGWITSSTSFASQMQDSLGSTATIFFDIPVNAGSGSSNKVTVTAISAVDANKTTTTEFYVSIYNALLQSMTVYPDSAVVALGDSIQFYVFGTDQHGSSINVSPTWQTTMGTISADGIFVCSEEGTATVTATDPVSGLTSSVIITTSLTVDAEDETELPQDYRLFQNYPNPFNPTTTIRFSLPSASVVKLEVYNILGQRVTGLVNEVKNSGFHEVKWNSGGLASGFYFYMIYTKALEGDKEFRDVKKMLLLK